MRSSVKYGFGLQIFSSLSWNSLGNRLLIWTFTKNVIPYQTGFDWPVTLLHAAFAPASHLEKGRVQSTDCSTDV